MLGVMCLEIGLPVSVFRIKKLVFEMVHLVYLGGCIGVWNGVIGILNDLFGFGTFYLVLRVAYLVFVSKLTTYIFELMHI